MTEPSADQPQDITRDWSAEEAEAQRRQRDREAELLREQKARE